MQKGSPLHSDIDFEVLLKSYNGKLKQWVTTWESEMKRGMLFVFFSRDFYNSFFSALV